MEKIALITGVSRSEGLGFEVAKQLKNKGFYMIISARDEAKAKAFFILWMPTIVNLFLSVPATNAPQFLY